MLKITRKSSSDSSTTSSSDSSPTAEKKNHDESKKEAKKAILFIKTCINKGKEIPPDAAKKLEDSIQKEVDSRDFSKNKNKSDSLYAIINSSSSYNKYIIKNAEKQLPEIKSSEDINKAKKLIEDAKKNTKQEKNNSPSKFKIVLELAELKKLLDDLITKKFKYSSKKISSQINKFLHCENEETKNIFKKIKTLYTYNIENEASENTDPAVEALCEHFKSFNINLNNFYIFDGLIKIKPEIIDKKNTKVIEYIQQVIKKEEKPEEVINALKEIENPATELNKCCQEINSKGFFYTSQAIQNGISAYRYKCDQSPSNSNPDNNQSLPIEKRNSLIAELNSMPDTGSSTPPNNPLTQVIPNPVSTPKKQADFSFMG